MEKLVLSNGAEYQLCVDGVNEYNGIATFKVRPMDGETKTVEDALDDFTGNETITAKIDDTAIRVLTGLTEVKSVELVPNYVINTQYVCPECGEVVENTATTCNACNATFDAPTINEVTANIFIIKVSAPDTAARLTDIESTVDMLSATLVEMQLGGLTAGDTADEQAAVAE